ncbi:uncharacterized protein BKCO1_1100032 [Diplodia corticola]|uniref:Uncharacterized protein n=1 Tax=Diplodia corticola TaxID=236234 RepID=A0A1J9RV30_9PEZI|nr:uncharacterized protein BKCO1_1100032 [Diplodia corticola]OJD36451.1 hypothetical protein BKCO1_1100032 [Diplodia corticola]
MTHPLFGSTPPEKDQEDPVLKAAQKILSINNVKNRILCHVSLPLSLEALPYTSLDASHGRYYRISRASLLGNYPEYSNYDGMWDTVVRIRLSNRGIVEVRDGDSWQPLSTYLSRLPAVKEYWAGPGSGAWLQALDWATNGQHFPLLALPGEIRNMIYDRCASFCYPYEFERGFNYMAAAGTDGLLYREYGARGSHLQAELFGRGRVLNGAGPVLALLLTSRQVHAEFAARLERGMEFRFQGAAPLRRFLAPKPLRPDLSALSKVTLQMTTWNMVKFFGVWIHQSARPWGEPDAGCLKGLRVKELELRLGHRENFEGYRLDTVLAPCCHRVLAGLILWAAKDYVKDIPAVSVEGCVPAAVKAAFLQLLADERAKVPSAVTQWDVIGKSAKLVEKGESWMVRTDSGLGCELLDHEHSCADMGPCTDDFCLSENNFTPRKAIASSSSSATTAVPSA